MEDKIIVVILCEKLTLQAGPGPSLYGALRKIWYGCIYMVYTVQIYGVGKWKIAWKQADTHLPVGKVSSFP